jgi:putative phosphotransacetylase
VAVDVSSTLNRDLVEQIVREVVLKKLRGSDKQGPKLVVHASARHMHVCREHMDILFGPGSELTEDRPLYQPGNYAAKETVTLIGPRSRLISNLRILGPMRKESQIELAFTDAISLGIDAPIRISGDIKDTPGCFVMGPKGMVELTRGVIRAAIHAHMSPDEAAYFGVKQGDMMKLRIGGDASVTFNRVQVRIDPATRLNVHMDTDEANACGLHLAKDIELFK